MPGLASYMAQYDHEHSSAWNKVLHGVGIPMIFAGVVLLILTKWIWGSAFLVGGWIFLFLGHRIEGNRPAFFQGPIYLGYYLVFLQNYPMAAANRAGRMNFLMGQAPLFCGDRDPRLHCRQN